MEGKGILLGFLEKILWQLLGVEGVNPITSSLAGKLHTSHGAFVTPACWVGSWWRRVGEFVFT